MLDRVEIIVKGGDGGAGAIGFRHEKFVPLGGPDGGNGGPGGDVIIRADPSVSNLGHFKPKRVYQAENGGNGGSNRKQGKKGRDLILSVPVGTVAKDIARADQGNLMADLSQPGQQVVVAGSGRGGLGNAHFVSSINQAPRIAQKGEAGEERVILLEIRLIADVGVIGQPNAGKSSLLSVVSAAHPEIASYPFTTRAPVLGVVEVGRRVFVMAEIPGLIKDAHLGRGLGHEFLRHVLRTKVLIHLIDGTSASPLADMEQVNKELSLFAPALAAKPQIVVINKIDLPEVRARIDELKETFARSGVNSMFISALTGEGVRQLMADAAKMLEREDARLQKIAAEKPQKVFRPQPRRPRAGVHKEDKVFVIDAPELERVIVRIGADNPDLPFELEKEFRRLGINRALEKAGARAGDKLRLGDMEWKW